ncbi:MAG: tetratricopeptide repeat protein [bacterium]
MMSKAIWTFIICLMFMPCVWAQTDAERAEAFILESKRLPVAERIDRAILTVQNSNDAVIVGEAARDLARFSKTPERAEFALAEIEALIGKSVADSEVFKRANLARARVLVRLDRKEEAQAIFKRAVVECWNENAYKEFFETFQENGDYGLMAIEEYKRQTADEYSDEIREFYDLGGDFVETLCHLRGMRVVNANSSAMEEVLPALTESERRPLAGRIAKALCLAGDDRYEEALAELDEVETILASENAPPSAHDENKDLPLYRAAILLFEGRDFDAMRAAFREYIDRNEDDRERVFSKALQLTYAMEYSVDDKRDIAELTKFLIESEFLADEEIRNQLPDHRVASLLDMHQQSLSWRYEWDDAARVCLQTMEQYYPDTLGGVSAAMNFGLYLWMRHYDLDGAERVLNDILDRAPYDHAVPHVKRLLARICIKKGEYDRAIELLDEAIARIGPSEGGPLGRCRERAISHRRYAIEARDSGGQPPGAGVLVPIQPTSGK